MRAKREKYYSERTWADHHGIEYPPEEFLAAVHRRNMWAFWIIFPLLIAFLATWFTHQIFLCTVVAALLVGIYVGLYIAGKA
ncbi:MAG: hypothetical protein WA655_20820 [Candidatus Korobacteraceae bacterium]